MVLWLFDFGIQPFVHARAVTVAAARPTGAAGGAGDGAVDAPQVVVDLALVVALVQQGGVQPGPGAVAPPAVEAGVNGVPFAVAFGQIAPGCAGAENPQDAVDHHVMGQPGPAGFAVVPR